jgi:hypothetical protein
MTVMFIAMHHPQNDLDLPPMHRLLKRIQQQPVTQGTKHENYRLLGWDVTPCSLVKRC